MSQPKKVLLASQIGDGRGHVSKLRIIGRSLKALGVDCSAALTNLEHADELNAVTTSVHCVPSLPYFHRARAQGGHPPAATYGEFLGDLGFASTSITAKHLSYWRQIIETERPDAVVAEQAPTALLAARSLSIPSVALGTTYTLPPTNLEKFPVLLDEFAACKWSETDMCVAISVAIEPFGLPPLTRLSEIYVADLSLPMGIRILDPYAEQRRDKRIPPDVGRSEIKQPWLRQRDEIFAYLSTGNRFDAMVIEALAKLRMPLRVYVAGSNETSAMRLRAAGVRIETAPVRPFQIARRSRVIFHSGSYGMMCLGIHAGIPQVAAPQQLEQLFNARTLQKAKGGCCIEPNEGPVHFDRINEAYESTDAQAEAVALALQTRPEFDGDPGAVSSARILQLIS